MSLQDGADLINAGIVWLRLPLTLWNNLSIFNVIEAMILLSILGWFIARVLKGKGHSEGVSQETYELGGEALDTSGLIEFETNGETIRESARQTTLGVAEDWEYRNQNVVSLSSRNIDSASDDRGL